MEPVRLGLIGAGRWGKRYIETLSRLASARLVHLASRNPASRALVPEGCRISSDWKSVAADPSLDGVILACPPSTHAELAEAALRAGIPVLIEKPMTLSAEEARRIASAARGTLAMTGHTHLFGPAFRALKAESARRGSPRATRSRAGNQGPVRADASVLWDWGPHDVAMCLDLFGSPPERIRAARVRAQRLPEGVGEALSIQLDFPGGRSSEILVSNIEPIKVRWFEAAFPEGRLVYDDLAPAKLVELGSGDEEARALPCDATLPLTALVEEFAALIAAGTREHPSLSLGVQVVEVLEECQRQLAAAGPGIDEERVVSPCA